MNQITRNRLPVPGVDLYYEIRGASCWSKRPGRLLPSPVLAQRVGLPIVDFPGDHVGYVVHPVESAARPLAVLAGER